MDRSLSSDSLQGDMGQGYTRLRIAEAVLSLFVVVQGGVGGLTRVLDLGLKVERSRGTRWRQTDRACSLQVLWRMTNAAGDVLATLACLRHPLRSACMAQPFRVPECPGVSSSPAWPISGTLRASASCWVMPIRATDAANAAARWSSCGGARV